MAEAFNSVFKAELVRNRGPWQGINDLEIATAEYIDWFNMRRLHGELGMIPSGRRRAGKFEPLRNPGRFTAWIR